MNKKKQPKALTVLFLTEMWERFGFYTMISIFILYLTNEMKLDDSQAFVTFGAYTSFAYLSTVAGGILADRLLGFRAAILIGATMMAVGYLLLQVQSESIMYISLGILVVGNGFFKPNVAGLLGTYYEKDDPRRDSGFTLFYMGINLGAFIASLGAGYIATTYGYTVAFAVAGVGKLLSITTFLVGRRYLNDHGSAPQGISLRKPYAAGLPCWFYLLTGILGSIGIASFLIQHGLLAGEILAVVGLLTTLYFAYEITREKPALRPKLFGMLVLFFFAVIFFAIYQQSGLSVTLYNERNVDLLVFGHMLPPSDVLSLNPLFILLLSPVFAWVWLRMIARGFKPSFPFKFALGLLFIGLAFWVLRFGGLTTGSDEKVALYWMVLFFLLYTMGELSLSPVGLAMVSALAPRRLAGFAMGMWLLSIAAANYIGGVIAKIASVPANTPHDQERLIYETAFSSYGLIAIASALLLFSLTPVLQRLMRH